MSSRTSLRTRSRVLGAALVIGFVSLNVGVLIAHATPPTGYELSIYTATPAAFWIGVGIAAATSLGVSFAATSDRLHAPALFLGGAAAVAAVGLPFVRGYHYYGTGDPLTHLGWAKDIAANALNPTSLLYPAIHLFADVVWTFSGLPLTRSLLAVVVVLAVVFVVFVPLVVRTITDRRYAVAIATVAAFMFFQINNIAVHMHAHPFTQTLLLSPLVLFLAFKYVRQPPAESRRVDVTALGALLAVAGAAAVLYHPQQAANLIVVFAGICAVQFAYRRYRGDHPIAGHRTLYAQTAVLTVVFAAWSAGDSRFTGNLDHVQRALEGYLFGGAPPAGDRVGSQASSLSAIGAGLPEMFVKLFLVSAVFSIAAGLLMAAVALGRAGDGRSTEGAFVTYLAAGTAGMSVVTGIYFAGSIAEHYFRHGAFLMLVTAIVGSLAFARVASWGGGRRSRAAPAAVGVALLVLLSLSVATIFPSPFIHQQSKHVTESHLSGYETTFAIADEGLPLAGIRKGPYRYSDAVHGVEASTDYDVSVSEEALVGLPESFDGAGYVVISEYDRQREVRAYEELRYSRESLRSVEDRPGVNLVESNGAVRLYHVPESDA